MLGKSIFSHSGLQFLSSRPGLSPPFNLGLVSLHRHYATTSDHPQSRYPWPKSPTFTPYELLNLSRGAPYSKARYYELVKIYHPDRPSNDISLQLRLERYKLIVAAHEILSDPARRAAYDTSGTGWDLHIPPDPEFPAGGQDMAIYANATWEDWERWQMRHHGKQQHVVDQRTFTRLVILLVLFGAALQASWISTLNSGHEQHLRDVSGDSMRFLTGRRDKATSGQMASNDARVQSFLISRDPTGSGLKHEESPTYQKELHPRGSVYSSRAAQSNGMEAEPVDEAAEDGEDSVL